MADLKAEAYKYYQQGFNVVAVSLQQQPNGSVAKKPLCEWGKWVNQRQTLEEFESQAWGDADGFAVVTAYPNNQGYYLAAVDYDAKNVGEDAKAKGKQLLTKFLVTRTEETVNKGIHLLYLSKVKPNPISIYHNSHALELIAGAKLCILAPSKGYTPLNDNPPTIVEDVEALFYEVLGVEDKRERVNEGLPSSLLEKWLRQILDSGRLKVAGEGSNYIYCHCPLPTHGTEDKHPSFVIHKAKFYAYCFKEDKAFSLKELAGVLGVKLQEEFAPEGEKAEKNVLRLGNFKLQVVEGDVFLFEANGKIRDCFRLSSLTKEATKKRLSNITKLDIETVNSLVSEFLFKLKTRKEGEETRKEEEEEQEKEQVFDEEIEKAIEEEVKRICEMDNQLEGLKPHLDVVVVGEDDNKKAILVLEAGSKFKELDKKQIIILKGMEGGGKTTLASNLTAPFKTKTVGRFTEHALEYSDLKGYEVLYIKELGSMDMDKQGVASIKFLSCDDGGFVVEYTVRDDAGRFRTEQKRIPAMTVISTTTRLLLDSQFERRAWLFNVDESEQQTERIKKWKAWIGQQKDEVKLGIRKITDYDFSREVLKRFIRRLQPQKIIIPFRETLAEALTSKVLRVRGDIDKLYTFIELYGLFNLKRLMKIKENVYAVTPEIAVEALNIILKPLANMLGGADERVKPLINALKEVQTVKDEYDEEGRKREVLETYVHAGAVIDKTVREQLAVKLGKSEKTVRAYLNYLEEKGFLSSDNKKPKTYTLLYPLSEIEKKLLEASAISESADNLRDKLEKEAQKWLKTRLEILRLQEGKNFLREECGEKEGLTKSENILNEKQGEKQKIFSPPQSRISNPCLDSFQGDSAERSLENRQNGKLTRFPMGEEWIIKREDSKVYAKDGSVMFQCELCARQGKPMFFATKHDLDLHIRAIHGGYPDYVR